MRLPSVRTQFLAFLIPFVGVSLTFGGTGIAARRANNTQSSRTRVSRTMRAAVGHEFDVVHEEPDKRWTFTDPEPCRELPVAAVAERVPVALPQFDSVDRALPAAENRVSSFVHSTIRGRAPPSRG